MKFIAKSKNKLSPTLIAEIEKKYQMKFPAALRNYYLSYGDCLIHTCEFQINGVLREVNAIIPLSFNERLHFSKIVERERAEEWIPKTFYPFAYDSGGNYYYWDATNGKIYLIFSDDVDKPKGICDSIDDFFSLLENCN